MHNRMFVAALYATATAHEAKKAVVNAKNNVVEHRAEIARLVGTAAVVGVASRVNGFRAGYAYAANHA